jgi:hypothetical protein
MPLINRPHRHRPFVAVAAALSVAGGFAAAAAAPALGSTTQQSIMEAGPQLLENPSGTLNTLRLLGVQRIRLAMTWSRVAPNSDSRKAPKHFQASNPASYPAANWNVWDQIVRDATADGIRIDLDLLGKAPMWAQSSAAKITYQGSLYPSPSAYQ